MSEEKPSWQSVEYEGFEIHFSTRPTEPESKRFTYAGYVCHPGGDPAKPGHTVPFHADGEESFKSEADAHDEAIHVGRTIVDGTHPDLSVLSLVTSGV
jgi:hypothetical protein